MASFQAKIGIKRLRKGKKKLTFCFVPARREIENSKKLATKLKKLKNIMMATFQAKISWKMLRKKENKNYRSVPFLPEA